MRGGWLIAAMLIALSGAPVANAQTCKFNYPGGSMEYPCPEDESGPGASSREWYEEGWFQILLAVIGIVGSAAAGGFAYYRTRRRRRTLTDLLKNADDAYTSGKSAPDLAIPRLASLRAEVRHRHDRGRLEDAQYLELDKRITDYIVRLRLIELDRRFHSLPPVFLAEVRRLVSDGAVSKHEADLVAMHAATHRVPEPHRSDIVATVRAWSSEDAKPAVHAATSS